MTLLAQFAATGGAGAANYIEDVFSTWLYTGTGANQTINNGIDLSGKGGLTWIKQRTLTRNHNLFDTARGATKSLFSDSTSSQITGTTTLTSFNANGFSLGDDSDTFGVNLSAQTYVSWTFRKQPKFFDVVTYTGNGVDGRFINHTLTSTPGAIFIKRTDTTSNWVARCKTSTGDTNLRLNDTSAADNTTGGINTNGYCGFADTSTFAVYTGATDISAVNASGATYVAYLFAHNAGGFGLTGTDNVISCGSFTVGGSGNATVNLGFEPQWVITKATDVSGNWRIADVMRGMTTNGTDAVLSANLSDAEASANLQVAPTATGFQVSGGLPYTATYIYIAIRRGPMKVPTTGTSVYSGVTFTGDSTVNRSLTAGFPPDLVIPKVRLNTGGSGGNTWDVDRLRGNRVLAMNASFDESVTAGYDLGSFNKSQTAFVTGTSTTFINSLGDTQIAWMMRRAPSFFDEVCYTGTGSATTQAHNLAAVPELIIIKARNVAYEWKVWSKSLGVDQALALNTSAAPDTNAAYWNSTTPTASVFSLGSAALTNLNSGTFVAYLFASAPGVSKVGSYTGTATTQVINCGFTSGSRFVMIKRTDSTGDWYVWDSSRGIVAGDDPYLLINSAAIEVTSTDYVDTAASGFELTATAPAAINASGGTFIFLSIA